jgi:riboflavin synthase
LFTGIVEELGSVVALERLEDGAARIRFAGPLVTSDAMPGDSIAVNGVCLTAVDIADGHFSADVMPESLRRSALGSLAVGDRVNLERPMTADGRFGGHIVQGHVDGVGFVRERRRSDNWDEMEIELPTDLSRYLVTKGSVTVDGVSLTVTSLVDGPEPRFSVSLVPTTLSHTTLGGRQPGELVNLEVDVIGKYVERLMGARDESR